MFTEDYIQRVMFAIAIHSYLFAHQQQAKILRLYIIHVSICTYTDTVAIHIIQHNKIIGYTHCLLTNTQFW